MLTRAGIGKINKKCKFLSISDIWWFFNKNLFVFKSLTVLVSKTYIREVLKNKQTN